MALNLAGFTYLMKQHGKEIVTPTINRNAPLFGTGKFPKKKARGVLQINPTTGALHGGPQADGANYQRNNSLDIVPLFGHRKIFTSQVMIPKGLANACDGSDQALNLVKQATEQSLGTLAFQIEQNIFDATIGTVKTGAAITGGAVTVTVDDATRFREGVKYLWNDDGTVNAAPFICTSIVIDADGLGGTVSFSTTATGTVTATEDSFILADSTNRRGLTTLSELAGNGNVYSMTGAIAGYHGTTIAHNDEYTSAVILRLLTAMRQRGANPTHIFMPLTVAEDHLALIGGTNYRRIEGDTPSKADLYGSIVPPINGVKVYVSPNVPGSKVYAIDEALVHLGEFTALDKVEDPRMAEDSYNLLATWAGEYEIRCDGRKGVGVITGITRP